MKSGTRPKRKAGGAWRIGHALALLWTAALVGAPLGPGDHPAVGVLTALPPLFLLAPVVAWIAAVLGRALARRASASDVAFAVGLAAAGASVAGWEIPESGLPHPERGSKLTVMTFNAHFDSRRMPRLGEYARARGVDVALIQEDVGRGDSPAAHLARELGGWHLAQAGETAIVSRWPLADVREVPLERFPGRVVLSARVRAPEPFDVVNVHWSAPTFTGGRSVLERSLDRQRAQLEQTLREFAARRGPTILGGDFNCPPRHPFARALATHGTSAFGTAGRGLGDSYPARAPILRIDHLFSDRGFVPVRAEVGPDLGSDHRPLIAEFVRRP